MDNETVVLINHESKNPISELELEKYFAVKALNENPGILGNAFTFGLLCHVLNNIKPDTNTWEPPTVLMFAKAVDFLNKKMFVDKPHIWHPEICEYIAQISHAEGWVKLPEVLEFAQKELNNLQPKEVMLDDDGKENQKKKMDACYTYLLEG